MSDILVPHAETIAQKRLVEMIDGSFAEAVAARGYRFNGALWEPEWNNSDVVILASAARSATTVSPDQINPNARGALVFLAITAAPGTDTVQISIEAKDLASGGYRGLLTGGAVSVAGSVTYLVYPGAGAATSGVAQVSGLVLPRTWRVRVLHSGAGSFTYSVGAAYVV